MGLARKPSLSESVLTTSTINPNVQSMPGIRDVQLLMARGQLREELRNGTKHPFAELYAADVGDAQAMGQKPVTFIRQMLTGCIDPGKLEDSDDSLPQDVKRRAREIVQSMNGQSIGSYSGEWGSPLVRKHVAEYIQRRDGGIPSNPEHIFLSNGAAGAVVSMLSMFASEEDGRKTGVLCPVPQFPLYNTAIGQLGLQQVDYYLDEESNWSLDVDEMEVVVRKAREVCDPRVLVVINPGNPTGQVLTRKCMEEIIQFAYREHLYIFADEVYQMNVWQEEVPFQSFKRVMVEMGAPYSSMELVSFMSVSKGYSCECGVRGGYAELFNPAPEVPRFLNIALQPLMSPSTIGQIVMDCVVREPVVGEASYDTFNSEKENILGNQKFRGQMVSKALNQFKRVTCNPVMGSMYAFARLHLPERAIEKAREVNMKPEGMYVMELMKATGICISPGYMYGQKQGTYHFRMTILGQEEKIRKSLKIFKEFNDDFMTKYEN